MKLGDAINRYREEHKMSMQDFADAANLSKGYISMLEKHHHPQSKRDLAPSMQTYNKVATAMHIDLNTLLSMLDEDSLVNVNSSEDTSYLSDGETALLDAFRQLNPEGQEKVQVYTDDLLSSGKYIKSDLSEMVDEK